MKVSMRSRPGLGFIMGALCLAALAGCESDIDLILPENGVFDVADGLYEVVVRVSGTDCDTASVTEVDTLQVCEVNAFSFPFVRPDCTTFEYNLFTSSCQASGNDGDCARHLDSEGWGIVYNDLWTVTVETQLTGSGACADTCEQVYSVSALLLDVVACDSTQAGRYPGLESLTERLHTLVD